MSVNPIVRDVAERLYNIANGIAQRGGEGSSDAEKLCGKILDALSVDREDLTRDAIRGIYSLLAIVSVATDEEFQQGEEIKQGLPDDLAEQINNDRRDNPGEPVKVIHLRTASEFDGSPMKFVWFPFVPAGEYSIMAAAGGNFKSAVTETLLKAGAKVDDKDMDGRTPLVFAVTYNENPKVTEALIKSGADCNSKNRYGLPVIMMAAQSNKNADVLRVLIEGGADYNCEIQNFNPMSYAAIYNPNPAVMELLHKKGLSITEYNANGVSPFLYACFYNFSSDMIQKFLHNLVQFLAHKGLMVFLD